MLTAGTLGTASGDFVAGDLGLGLAFGSVVLAAIFAIVLLIFAHGGGRSKSWYWASIVTARTAGTTLGDLRREPACAASWAAAEHRMHMQLARRHRIAPAGQEQRRGARGVMRIHVGNQPCRRHRKLRSIQASSSSVRRADPRPLPICGTGAADDEREPPVGGADLQPRQPRRRNQLPPFPLVLVGMPETAMHPPAQILFGCAFVAAPIGTKM